MDVDPTNPYPIEWYLERLEGVEDAGGGQYYAWCPMHADAGTTHKGLSLAIKNGRIVCNCFTCNRDEAWVNIITLTLHLEGHHPHTMAPVVNLKAVRTQKEVRNYKGKDAWVHKTGIEWWVWKQMGVGVDGQSSVLFTWSDTDVIKGRRLENDTGKDERWWDGDPQPLLWPTVESELPPTVWITAGESDCGTARAAGHHAYAWMAGEGNKPEWINPIFQVLKDRGAKELVVCSDIDKTGLAFRQVLVDEALDVGLEVAIVHLEEILNPFLGRKDLNHAWHDAGCDPAAFKERVTPCIRQEKIVLNDDLSLFMQMMDEAEDWLVEDLVARGDKVIIAAAPKTGKTFFALELIRALVTGTNVMGRPEWKIPRPMKVLFIEEEGSGRAMRERLRNLCLTDEEQARIAIWHRRDFSLSDNESYLALNQRIASFQPDVIVLDPLQAMIPGVDENNAQEMNVAFWAPIRTIQSRNPGLTCIVLHHSNKAASTAGDLSLNALRGSGRNAGEIDLALMLVRDLNAPGFMVKMAIHGRDVEPPHDPGLWMNVSVDFAKRGEEPRFKIDATHDLPKVTPKDHQQVEMYEQVRQAIEDGAHTQMAIAEKTSLNRRTVKKHLDELVDKEVVVHDPDGRRGYFMREEADDE